MADHVQLGEITCPSGELVLMDGGYLRLWSGDRAPEDGDDPDIVPAVDFEVVGPDADAAARAFDRRAGHTLYDIPTRGADEFRAGFDRLCRDRGLDAALRQYERQVPHRTRVRTAIAEGDPGFIIHGVPVVAIGNVPAGHRLPVLAYPAKDWGWAHLRIVFRDNRVATVRPLDPIVVDNARLVFADADALNSWIHEDPIDGLADIVFWGLHQEEIAAEFGAVKTGTAGDDCYGWVNLPVREAYQKAVALGARRASAPERRFPFDFRPHSHHWQVMAKVRAAEHEAATIEVSGAQLVNSQGDT